eukprot:COSAG01_NODE_5750_length_4058_cov_1.778030_3_plen_80_part_00
MPGVWVWLFNQSYKGSSWISQLCGPGAHFLLAALLRLLGRQIMVGTRDSDLFLADEARTQGHGGGETNEEDEACSPLAG